MATKVTPETRTKVLLFFRLKDEAIAAFAQELKKLTDEEKDELAQGVLDHQAAQAS